MKRALNFLLKYVFTLGHCSTISAITAALYFSAGYMLKAIFFMLFAIYFMEWKREERHEKD